MYERLSRGYTNRSYCIRLVLYWTENPIADYDIQMYHIDDDITILGHTFHGLKGLRLHCTRIVSIGPQLYCSPTKEHVPLENIHVRIIDKSYPNFDSYDYSDTHCYENYIFAPQSITTEQMHQYANIKRENNADFTQVLFIIDSIRMV